MEVILFDSYWLVLVENSDIRMKLRLDFSIIGFFKLAYNIVFVLGIQQNDSVLYIHISDYFPLQVIIRNSILLPMLLSKPWLLIYLIYSSVSLLIPYF